MKKGVAGTLKMLSTVKQAAATLPDRQAPERMKPCTARGKKKSGNGGEGSEETAAADWAAPQSYTKLRRATWAARGTAKGKAS